MVAGLEEVVVGGNVVVRTVVGGLVVVGPRIKLHNYYVYRPFSDNLLAVLSFEHLQQI